MPAAPPFSHLFNQNVSMDCWRPLGEGRNGPHLRTHLRTMGPGCPHSLGMFSSPHVYPCSLPVTLLLILWDSSEKSRQRWLYSYLCSQDTWTLGHTVRENLSYCIVIICTSASPPNCLQRQPVQRWIQVSWSRETYDSGGGWGHLWERHRSDECSVGDWALEGNWASGCGADASLVSLCSLSCCRIWHPCVHSFSKWVTPEVVTCWLIVVQPVESLI